MTGCTSGEYGQFETSPEAIEQELRPAVCERRQIFKANYRIDNKTCKLNDLFFHTCVFEPVLSSPSLATNPSFPSVCLVSLFSSSNFCSNSKDNQDDVISSGLVQTLKCSGM